jgi:hypothetical protein
VASPEDAVFADLDSDGAVDVISSCEGRERSVFVHWAPKDPARYLEASAWTTAPLSAARDAMQWMFITPMQVDGKHGVDLVAGAKNQGAQVGWFESPPDPRRLEDWEWHPVLPAGWIMTLLPVDMDGDGDPDLLVSDRRGDNRGAFWLENPGWQHHPIGGQGREVMFVASADLDRDGLRDVLVPAKPREILFCRRRSRDGRSWEQFSIRTPESAGHVKAVTSGDIDLDGKPDLVFSCEGADGRRPGVLWLSYRQAPTESEWRAHDISGAPGVKYDLVELLDVDADGDLDVLTCEETDNLGVIWYENPAR